MGLSRGKKKREGCCSAAVDGGDITCNVPPGSCSHAWDGRKSRIRRERKRKIYFGGDGNGGRGGDGEEMKIEDICGRQKVAKLCFVSRTTMMMGMLLFGGSEVQIPLHTHKTHHPRGQARPEGGISNRAAEEKAMNESPSIRLS